MAGRNGAIYLKKRALLASQPGNFRLVSALAVLGRSVPIVGAQ